MKVDSEQEPPIIRKNHAYSALARKLKEENGIDYPDDLYYTGVWDGLHHLTHKVMTYCKDEHGNPTRSSAGYKYSDIAFNDEDAANGNLDFFVKGGYTRIGEGAA